MKPNFGAWLLAGAALASLFAPRRRAGRQAAPAPKGAEPRRLFALVQTRPNTVVLALSARAEDLEREAEELNQT